MPILNSFFIVAVLSQVPGQPAAPVVPAAPQIEVLHNELDAVGWVFDAITKYSEADQPYIRFVYLPPWADPEWLGVMDFAVNAACGQTSLLHKGDRHAGGWLLAYNLKLYAPSPAQLARLVATWDSLAVNEPRFHLPQTNVVEIVVQQNGKPIRQKVSKTVAILAPHLQAALAKHATNPEKSERIDVLVASLTRSTGAIYPADFLLEQLLTSLRGKYPEFRQIDFKVEKATPLQVEFSKRGFFLEQSLDQRGEKGALLLVSGVTGKSRVIVTVYGIQSRQPLAATFDFKDNRIRPDQQFIRNVIEFQPLADASEIFIPLPNGLIEYVLADAKGNIQRAAPPDVVADSTKPDGHTKELEMGMSCIICHSPQSGYKTARNDMELLLGADTDFFGEDFFYTDRAGKRTPLTREEAVALVAGRFGERIDEPDGVLGRARRDFSRAVVALTGYEIKGGEPGPAEQLGAKIKEIYHDYRYRVIDAERACLELGVKVPPGQGRAVLKQLVPPPAAGGREDILISLLRNGAEIKRDDLDPIYGEMARRAVATRPAFAKKAS